jgi:hypothetical protein
MPSRQLFTIASINVGPSFFANRRNDTTAISGAV